VKRLAKPRAPGRPRPLQNRWSRIGIALLATQLAVCVSDDLSGGCEPCTYPAGFGGCISIYVAFHADVPAEALESLALRLRVGQVLALRVEAGESMRVVAWRSTNPDVAVVVAASEATGELRALSPGRTQIGATVRFKRGDCELPVVLGWLCRPECHIIDAVEVVP